MPEIAGNIEIGGEEKRWRKLEESRLSAELLEPFRASALSTEHSQIQIRFDGRKVLDILWDSAGSKAIISGPASGRGRAGAAQGC
jgi:hypothetical protein